MSKSNDILFRSLDTADAVWKRGVLLSHPDSLVYTIKEIFSDKCLLSYKHDVGVIPYFTHEYLEGTNFDPLPEGYYPGKVVWGYDVLDQDWTVDTIIGYRAGSSHPWVCFKDRYKHVYSDAQITPDMVNAGTTPDEFGFYMGEAVYVWDRSDVQPCIKHYYRTKPDATYPVKTLEGSAWKYVRKLAILPTALPRWLTKDGMLTTGQYVLGRDRPEGKWRLDIYSHYSDMLHTCVSFKWQQCVPFLGNEHLVGTTGEPTKPIKDEAAWQEGDLVWWPTHNSSGERVYKPAVFLRYTMDGKRCVIYEQRVEGEPRITDVTYTEAKLLKRNTGESCPK